MTFPVICSLFIFSISYSGLFLFGDHTNLENPIEMNGSWHFFRERLGYLFSYTAFVNSPIPKHPEMLFLCQQPQGRTKTCHVQL